MERTDGLFKEFVWDPNIDNPNDESLTISHSHKPKVPVRPYWIAEDDIKNMDFSMEDCKNEMLGIVPNKK
jgi:hypothetical protein